MKSLYYFSAFDLMVGVDYDGVDNQLLYSAHRRMTSDERITVENYLLRNVAPKTSYFDRMPSRLIFLGIEQNLVVELNQFHVQNSIKEDDQKVEIDQIVRNLINSSLSNYYFELIGNEIIELRKKIQQEANDTQLINSEAKMAKLVEAYNWYTGKSLAVADVIPQELRDRMRFFYAEEKN